MKKTDKIIINFKPSQRIREFNENYFKVLLQKANEDLKDIKDSIANFNINDKDYIDNFKLLDEKYNDIEMILEQLMDSSNNINETLKKSINKTDIYNRKIQNNFMDLKVRVLFQMANNLQNKFDEEIAKQIENTQEVTNNTIFSIAAVFLGITLTSAMVAGIQYITHSHMLLYFLTIGWVAVTIMTLASILIKRFDKKSLWLSVIVVIYTIGVVGYGVYVEKEDNISEQNLIINEKYKAEIIDTLYSKGVDIKTISESLNIEESNIRNYINDKKKKELNE